MDQQDDQQESRVSFGFHDVPASEKARLVRGVFSSVAESYDLMNDVMSAGVHRLWKDDMVAWLNVRPGQSILDVAGGTGDIAFRMARAAMARGGAADITVCDINYEMLAAGTKRANVPSGVFWVCGDAERLPVPDASMDAYTIAFGIRNVTHIDVALKEAFRVLRPGGRFLCLEVSRVQAPMI
jgi:demethylmenaquinone methyltransferase/2-methoxy-6-polyprenyl-1,4-benzoquinol methylase